MKFTRAIRPIQAVGHRFWGCEINAEIFAIAEKRLQETANKQHLFDYKIGIEYGQN
jgi:DNA modification methylase